MEKTVDKTIITVVGKDTVGIIAKVCTYLAENGVNILDISQTIVSGYFNMMMITDISGATKSFAAISDEMEKLDYIDGKSDWIDLRASEEVKLHAGELALIPLGVAMQLPKGYEAHLVPRSSTFKTWGLLQTNSMGVVDGSYCGDNDMWRMPVYATRDTVIHVNDRIAQFRIMENQPKIDFEEVEHLAGVDRGGFGSTGKA